MEASSPLFWVSRRTYGVLLVQQLNEGRSEVGWADQRDAHDDAKDGKTFRFVEGSD